MPPVPFPSAADDGIRRHSVPQSPLTLFPILPTEPDPEHRAGDSAPVSTGPGGISSDTFPADCHPPRNGTWRVPHDADGRSRRAPVPLVGIARLAASSPPAESRRKSTERPEYYALPVRSILNHCDSDRVPFEWTINPYRGCEFACRYCYARYTHEYMGLDGAEFDHKIFVKQNPGTLLARDLLNKHSRGDAEHIAIGTATDPYQPAESEFGVTRACLEEFAKRPGMSLSITTKSNQVVRDLDLLKEIAAHSALYINVTVTTMRPRLARLLEPRAPRPDLRMAAVKQLRDAGLFVGVFASPLLPGITDREADLEAVAAAARDAGAQWFFSGVLFLMPSSKKLFLPFVREKFPRLARQYEDWYAKEGYAPEAYRKMIAGRVAKLREKYELLGRPWAEISKAVSCAQMSLTWNAASASPAA